MNTLSLIKGGLINPKETWQSYLEGNYSWKDTAISLTLPLIVVSTILMALFNWLFASYSMFGVYMGVGATIKQIIASLISISVASFIFAILAKVFGGNNDFNRAFNALSLTAIPGSIGGILGSLPMVGVFIALIFGILSIVYLYKIIPLYLEVPQSKRVLHFIVSVVVTIVVMFIIGSALNLNRSNDYKINTNNVGANTITDMINKAQK